MILLVTYLLFLPQMRRAHRGDFNSDLLCVLCELGGLLPFYFYHIIHRPNTGKVIFAASPGDRNVFMGWGENGQ
jgi:hypothetical protein